MAGFPNGTSNYSIKLLLMGTVSAVLIVSAVICSLLILQNAREAVEEELASAYELAQELITPAEASLDLADANLDIVAWWTR